MGPTITERFVPVRPLGEGGMGTVWLVYDEAREQYVALKRARSLQGPERVHFKREFRTVEALRHPNLARLYELGEDAEGPWFTMEAVDGVDLLRWCRGAGPRAPSGPAIHGAPTSRTPPPDRLPEHRPALGELDWARFAHALPQLLEALSWLHAHDIVHRDLKPANVMVAEDGTLKLLDFGIVADLREPPEAEPTGTPGYMAPEQIDGGEVTPAVDLYALGALLFELVAGRPAFEGSPMARLVATLRQAPPRLGEVVPGAPAPIDALCDALLSRAPAARPSPAEVARALRPLGVAEPAATPEPTGLVGRRRALDSLAAQVRAAGLGASPIVLLEGRSGVGKTALAEATATTASRRGLTVLRSRGRPNERVAFNAVDALVDGLALRLAREPERSPALQAAARCAARTFPALAELLDADPNEAPTPAGRRALFAALRALLAHVAARDGLLLLVDDLQWADADSTAALAFLGGALPPRCMLLFTRRDDGPDAAGLLDGLPLIRQRVESLPPNHVLELVRRHAPGAPGERALRVVERCAGRPFLAEAFGRALARHGTVPDSAEQTVALVLADAPPPSRALLAALLAADDWVAARTLARWVECPVGEVEEALTALADGGLIRWGGRAGADADLYHDGVREAAAALVSQVEWRRAHAAIAAALADAPDPQTAARRVRHLLALERFAEAGRLAADAAEAAGRRAAFGLAADLYTVALEHAPGADEDALRDARARAFEGCGRYLDAAADWARLAPHDPLAGLHEAHALIAAHRLDEGGRRLDALLRARGEPPIGARLPAVAAATRLLLGPATPRPATGIDGGQAEVDIKLGLLIGFLHPLAGLRFLFRACERFDAAGDRPGAARALLIIGHLASFGDGRPGRSRRAARFRRAAVARVGADQQGDHWLAAARMALDGVDDWRARDFDGALRRLTDAVDANEAAGKAGTLDHALLVSYVAQAAALAERQPLAERWVARLDALTHDRGGVIVRSHVYLLGALLRARRGRFDEAEARLAHHRARLSDELPQIQRAVVDVTGALVTARTDPPAARRIAWRGHRAGRRYALMSSMFGGLYAGVLALTEAVALRVGDPEARPGRVRRLLGLTRRRPAFLPGLAWRAQAYVEDHRDRPEQAVQALRRAIEVADQEPLERSVARYQLGLRLGGDEGDALRARALADCRAAGADPVWLEEDPSAR